MQATPPVITSRTNAKVKALRAALSGEARQPGDLLGLEGKKLIHEAHSAGLRFETVFLREDVENKLGKPWLAALRTENWAVLSGDVFDSVVATSTPQGVAATWRICEPQHQYRSRYPGLVIENVQDPGNLGTLIRSAAAFGMGDVLITPETANPWNPKVVRSAAGSLFRTHVRRLSLPEIAEELHRAGVRLFAAVSDFLSGPAYGYPQIAAKHGVLTGRLENAHAEASLQHASHLLEVHASAVDQYPASFSIDTDFVEPCAVLIGNEGSGLSQEARRLANEQVLIPCSVESLNAAVAGSVLMYEVMRQRSLRSWARKQGLRP